MLTQIFGLLILLFIRFFGTTSNHDSSKPIKTASIKSCKKMVGILKNSWQNLKANFKRKRVSRKTKRDYFNRNKPRKETSENTVAPKPPISKLGDLC